MQHENYIKIKFKKQLNLSVTIIIKYGITKNRQLRKRKHKRIGSPTIHKKIQLLFHSTTTALAAVANTAVNVIPQLLLVVLLWQQPLPELVSSSK